MLARLATIVALLAALTTLSAGCGGSKPAPATERLWVSSLPTSPKAPFTAFVTARASDDRYYGSFYHGSMLRGGHDAFRWLPADDHHARLVFLQDESERTLRLTACEPTSGFDLCVQVRGGPYGVERYQSRKRWVVGRKARGALEARDAMALLADEDPDLTAAMAQ